MATRSGWWTLRRVYVATLIAIFGGALISSWLRVDHSQAYAEFWLTVDGGIWDAFLVLLDVVFYNKWTFGLLLYGTIGLLLVGGAIILGNALRPHARRARRWIARRT